MENGWARYEAQVRSNNPPEDVGWLLATGWEMLLKGKVCVDEQGQFQQLEDSDQHHREHNEEDEQGARKRRKIVHDEQQKGEGLVRCYVSDGQQKDIMIHRDDASSRFIVTM